MFRSLVTVLKTANAPVMQAIVMQAIVFPLTHFYHLYLKVHSASQSTSLTHLQAGGCWAEVCASCGWSWTTFFAQRLSSTSSSLATTVSCPSHTRWVAAFLLGNGKDLVVKFLIFFCCHTKCKVLQVYGFTPGRWGFRSLVGGSVASSSQMCPSAKVNHHWPLQAQSHP